MTTITQHFITHPITRPAVRPNTGSTYMLRRASAVVMHWTANKSSGADALAHREFFNNGSPGAGGVPRAASAHYGVDSWRAIQYIPTNEVAFHCGDKPLGRYKKAGRDLITQKGAPTPNYYTIGIEMCVNEDGDWAKTYTRSAELAARELVRFNLPIEGGLLRHFDITGKKCPDMMLKEEDWIAFKAAVRDQITALESRMLWRGVCNTEKTNVRPLPGMKSGPVGTLYQGEPVLISERSGNWLRVIGSGWVFADLISK